MNGFTRLLLNFFDRLLRIGESFPPPVHLIFPPDEVLELEPRLLSAFSFWQPSELDLYLPNAIRTGGDRSALFPCPFSPTYAGGKVELVKLLSAHRRSFSCIIRTLQVLLALSLRLTNASFMSCWFFSPRSEKFISRLTCDDRHFNYLTPVSICISSARSSYPSLLILRS